MKKIIIVVFVLLAVGVVVAVVVMMQQQEGPTPSPTASNEQASQGSYIVLDLDQLLDTYGNTPQAVYKSHPEVLDSLKSLEKTFTEYDMNVSFGYNEIVHFSDGRKMLFMKGCFPHACGDSNKAALYDPASKKTYLVTLVNIGPGTATSSPKYKSVFLGDPDPLVEKFLSENYQGRGF